MLTYCLRYELLKYLPSSVHLPEMLRFHNGIYFAADFFCGHTSGDITSLNPGTTRAQSSNLESIWKNLQCFRHSVNQIEKRDSRKTRIFIECYTWFHITWMQFIDN